LSSLDHAEGVFLPGYLHIRLIVGRYLQKYTVIAAAFVSLAGRMQKSRPEP
jgi:hypothetical protein